MFKPDSSDFGSITLLSDPDHCRISNISSNKLVKRAVATGTIKLDAGSALMHGQTICLSTQPKPISKSAVAPNTMYSVFLTSYKNFTNSIMIDSSKIIVVRAIMVKSLFPSSPG